MSTDAPIKSDADWLAFMLRPHRILLVDDDQDFGLIIKRLTNNYNCVVEEEKDGNRVVSRLQAGEKFDTIWLDLKLPGTGGVSVFREIRRWEHENDVPEEEHTPVVIVSGYLDRGIIEEVHRVGFAPFIRKPDDFNRRFISDLFHLLRIKRNAV